MTAPESLAVLADLVAERIREDRSPRLAYRIEEAAALLGVSPDWFVANVVPSVRVVRRGRMRLIPAAELRAWLDREAAYALGVRS